MLKSVLYGIVHLFDIIILFSQVRRPPILVPPLRYSGTIKQDDVRRNLQQQQQYPNVDTNHPLGDLTPRRQFVSVKQWS